MKQNKVPKNEYTNGEPSPYRKNPFKKDVFYGDDGQYAYPGQVTRIPGDAFGTHITMKGINEPLYARDDQGNEQMMQPGEDYTFPGQYVTEYPQMAKNGGGLLNKTLTCSSCGWSWKAVDGGKDIATCHKCGGTAKLAYGGDPSLANIEGHYPFGGIHTKTHTHMKEGGWLDELEELPQAQYGQSGPNPETDPPVITTASNVGSVNEDELFDQYYQLQKQLEDENKRVTKVRGNLIPVAKSLDEADSKILLNKEGPAYKAFQKSRYATSTQDLKKAIQEYPEELKNVLPGRGNYNIALADPKKYKATDELYCTPYGCFTYQKAGATDVPIVAGNFGFVGGIKEGKLPFKKVSASEAEPGDMGIVYGMQPADYRGDPTTPWVNRPHHTTVLAGKPTFDKKGKAVGFPMYNANEGNRLNYEKAYRDAAEMNDTDYEFYRYIGQTPKYEQQLKDLKNKLSTTPMESRPILLPISEEPELELKQDGGGSIVNYLASQGKDYSKAARQKLAKETGIKDYDFSAAKNTELLNKLQTAKAQPAPVVAKQTASSNYMVKPIGKTYAPPSIPDYSNLSVANQATLNKLAAKDPARTKALTAQAHELDIKKKFENLNDAEKIVERYKRVRESDESEGNMLDKDFWTRENWAKNTQATADRLRLFPNDPNSFIDDYLNPGVLVGNMVSAIGSAPLKAKEENSILPYFKAAAAPVVMGAFKMNPFDFVGSGAVKAAGKEVLKAGEKAVIKQGLKQAETKLPQAFGEAAAVSEVEAAAIKSAKGTGQELDKITNPTYVENLRTQGFTKSGADEIQRRDLIKKAYELHGKDPRALENYVKNYTGFPSVKKFTKEYENIMAAEPVLPYRAVGKYTAKPQTPLKQKDIVQDINNVPKSQQKAAIKELQSDPLLANQPGVKNAVAGKITKKAFESTHMPIANSEQQILAKKNQVMEKLFGDTRANPTQDIGDVMKHVEAAPENSVFMGANSLSDSSFPLYTLQAQRAITQGKVKPLFLGFQELNPWGHMYQSGLNPETIVSKLNQSISGFNKGLAGKAKLPNAYIKNGKVYYPNMALQKGAAEELVMEKLSRASSGYKPNIQKASGRAFSGMTREEPKAIGRKLSAKNIPYQQSEPSLLAAKTGSYALGGNWLDDLEEEYRRGGSLSASGLKKKAKKYGTSKNIQSSINKIFLKNQDIFGPSGRNIYNPNSKFEQGGGWLDNLI